MGSYYPFHHTHKKFKKTKEQEMCSFMDFAGGHSSTEIKCFLLNLLGQPFTPTANASLNPYGAIYL